VLITLEATRPDHLGCYNSSQTQTSTLDALAREGVLFEEAVSTSPLTLPAHASILTGQYPPTHGVRDDAGFTLADDRVTLAGYLHDQGYVTAAAVGTKLLSGDAGWKQGFDSYDEPSRGSRRATAVVDDAAHAVASLKPGPFFLWVELDDPRAPYEPPPQYAKPYATHPYDGELAAMDAQMKRLLDVLAASHKLDNTIVAAIADHGESLGEHGEETHGILLYDATLKVPLIVRFEPRLAGGTRVKRLISAIDLAPTLVDLMGLPPMRTAQGQSVLPAMLGQKMPDRDPVYAESLHGQRAYGWAPLRALRTDRRKFIDAPAPEVYDVRRDPSETINVAGSDADEVQAAGALLAQLRKAMGDATGPQPVSGAKPPRDPKTAIAAHNLYERAETAVERGQPDQAIPLLRQALGRDPGNPAATSLLTGLLGKPVKPAGERANTFASQWNLGNALYVQGKYDEAARAFQAALGKNPKSVETKFALGNALAGKGDLPAAEKQLRDVVAAQPNNADGWNKLGIVLDRSNRRPEALEAFTRALDVEPDHADALFNRAKVELLETYVVDARRDVDRLLAAHPDYAAARFLEAHLCVAEKNPDGAKEALRKFLALPNLNPGMKAAGQDMLKKIGG
jgi:arylsulfatase A-like enzyme/cytochrome c-type biogenesis protein CcmH/NrfG